jgi:hypothetical protein
MIRGLIDYNTQNNISSEALFIPLGGKRKASLMQKKLAEKNEKISSHN